MRSVALVVLLVLGACVAQGERVAVTHREPDARPRVLAVTAHPDDETVFAATLYKISTHLGGACDLAVLTNGEGGFKYATLAERVYGLELTDEVVGRRELPRIRRAELLAGCRLLAIRNLFLLGQRDHRYTRDPGEVLAKGARVWDLESVDRDLRQILTAGSYDYVFTMAPVEETHGHHQAATILALRSVGQLPQSLRPVVLCARAVAADEEAHPAPGLASHPLTRVRTDAGPWTFDRRSRFGFRKRLDYRVLVNLVIAQHVSQGTMQLAMNRGDVEQFFLFTQNPEGAAERVTALFESLAGPQFRERTYGPSAGTNAVLR